MPKPPVSAYLLYSNTVQQRFKEKYPNLNQKEIAKKIGMHVLVDISVVRLFNVGASGVLRHSNSSPPPPPPPPK